MIAFTEDGHRYSNISGEKKEWISVSTLIHKFGNPFDAVEGALKSSKNRKSKWYGLSTAEIEAAWKEENIRSTTLGHAFHKKQEDSFIGNPEAIFTPTIDGIKPALSQKFTPGIYLEPIVYLASAGIAGQVDKLFVYEDSFNINDYKTNKEIKKKSYVNWEGVSKKMLKPLHHMDECEYNTYALQLSLYAYIINRNNPLLKVGKLTIEHVSFELSGENKYGYPIVRLDEKGDPIVKGIEEINLPYNKTEVMLMLDWLKNK